MTNQEIKDLRDIVIEIAAMLRIKHRLDDDKITRLIQAAILIIESELIEREGGN